MVPQLELQYCTFWSTTGRVAQNRAIAGFRAWRSDTEQRCELFTHAALCIQWDGLQGWLYAKNGTFVSCCHSGRCQGRVDALLLPHLIIWCRCLQGNDRHVSLDCREQRQASKCCSILERYRYDRVSALMEFTTRRITTTGGRQHQCIWN